MELSINVCREGFDVFLSIDPYEEGGGGIISMAFNTDTMTTSYKTLTL